MNKKAIKLLFIVFALLMLSSIIGCTKKNEPKGKEIQKTEEDTQFMRLKRAKERNDKKEIEAIMQEINNSPTNSVNGKQDKNKANGETNNNKNIEEKDNNIPLRENPKQLVIENKQTNVINKDNKAKKEAKVNGDKKEKEVLSPTFGIGKHVSPIVKPKKNEIREKEYGRIVVTDRNGKIVSVKKGKEPNNLIKGK